MFTHLCTCIDLFARDEAPIDGKNVILSFFFSSREIIYSAYALAFLFMERWGTWPKHTYNGRHVSVVFLSDILPAIRRAHTLSSSTTAVRSHTLSRRSSFAASSGATALWSISSALAFFLFFFFVFLLSLSLSYSHPCILAQVLDSTATRALFTSAT
jgi:hypothetical protein